VTPPILELSNVTKDYRGLRPLRIQTLILREGESVALVGLDQLSAEVFVNLVTGATLPDAGHIVTFGRSTRDIGDAAEWLSLVDRFGIVSERAVLLETLTVLQNLAMPLTLEIEPLTAEARQRASDLAREVGLAESAWETPVAPLDAASKLRVRAARALALDPRILLLEHPSAGLGRDDAAALARELRAIAARRGAALVAATLDEAFARAVAARVLRWEPATGRLSERRGWLRGRLG
jgi:ABC-type lipoprotein export system ATPase subunit